MITDTPAISTVLTVGADPRCDACDGDGCDVERDPDTRMGTIVECGCLGRNAERAAQMLYGLGDMLDRWLGIPGDGAFTPAFELAANGVRTE
jgi:hypothetical protein